MAAKPVATEEAEACEGEEVQQGGLLSVLFPRDTAPSIKSRTAGILNADRSESFDDDDLR